MFVYFTVLGRRIKSHLWDTHSWLSLQPLQ